MTETTAAADPAPLLAPWAGPHGGAPDFASVRLEAFKPAILAAIEENRSEIAAITADAAAPTFDNTLAALERSGAALRRVETVFDVWTSALNDKPMQAIEKEMAPVFAAFADEIIQNEALFSRIKAVHEGSNSLAGEQRRLALVTHRNFARRGALLGKAGKSRLAAINQDLARLYTAFSQNVLADEEDHFLTLQSEADLAGLPATQIEAAAAAARERGLGEVWLITNTRSSMEPFLTYSSRRDLREKGWRMWVGRGDNGGAHDNNAIITEILALRAEKATLLGPPTFAHWICADQMAKTPDAAMELLLKMWRRPRPRPRRRSPRCAPSPKPKRRVSCSSPGTTATTPRRCARRGTTSTRTR